MGGGAPTMYGIGGMPGIPIGGCPGYDMLHNFFLAVFIPSTLEQINNLINFFIDTLSFFK